MNAQVYQLRLQATALCLRSFGGTPADWAGPDALVKRLNWARTTAGAAVVTDVNAVALSALGRRMGERTRSAVARAESRPEALTLLLMSPEFQRR